MGDVGFFLAFDSHAARESRCWVVNFEFPNAESNRIGALGTASLFVILLTKLLFPWQFATGAGPKTDQIMMFPSNPR